MTPTELHAIIGRALVESASRDDRRAARQACLTLAAVFGEPGEPMTFLGVPARSARVDPDQVLDFLSAQMRAYVADHETNAAQQAKAAGATTPEAAARNAAPPQSPPPAAPTPRAHPAWLRPRPIPLVPFPHRPRRP